MEQNSPKSGEPVAVTWKKADGSARGGSEGVVLGVLGDEVTGQYLVIDRNTYQDSFKSALFHLNIFDLKVIAKQDVDSIRKVSIRQRPPGIYEKFTMSIEANYRSNIDFDSTILKVEERGDCKHKRTGNQRSETYQMVIEKIDGLLGATIEISCGRMIQIFCKHEDLDRCINWIKEAVELLPDHKRLVLIPTKITYKINDTYKEPRRPTDEIICRIAAGRGDQPVVLPIGWAHMFFVELDENPLQGMFPNDQPLESFVFEKDKREKDDAVPRSKFEEKPQQKVDLHFSRSGVDVKKYLGASAPVMRVKGTIETPEDEERLMHMWSESRSDRWQWFENGQFHGKVRIHDLTIDEKKGVYSMDIRKYLDSEFGTANQ